MAEPNSSPPASSKSTTKTSKLPHTEASKKPLVWVDGNNEGAEDSGNTQNDGPGKLAEFKDTTGTGASGSRRNMNGAVGSVYSGNKIRHLKKEDGIPLWRKDIQLEFLRCVFDDRTNVFTKASDGAKNCSFAEIYVDAMARSGKTSKVLRDKMLADHVGAASMAMICLLVNIGRMNTTLNFFPEMRAQLRTYHAIPSLQAQQDSASYKQLQDAPRLKSILKGASEETDQPNTLEKIKAAPIPRTNPVNLIFVLQQFAPKVSETHFVPPRDFFDLVMRSTLSSKSRARAFLWLMWWYLESDFSREDALNNPFGPGEASDPKSMPVKVPHFESLTEDQANAENVDTPEELDYGTQKQQERRRILEEDETVGPPLKRSRKAASGDHAAVVAISDTERTRSPSPSSMRRPRHGGDRSRSSMLANSVLNEKSPSRHRYQPLQSKAEQSSSTRPTLKSKADVVPGSSPPAPPGSGHPVLSSGAPNGYRRSRPETSHQRAVNMNRKARMNHILHKQLVTAQRDLRREKRTEVSSFGMQVIDRTHDCSDMYDSEDESSSWGPAGLIPTSGEREDYGEEAMRHKQVIERAIRRLLREDGPGSLPGLRLDNLKTKHHKSRDRGGGAEIGQPTPPPRKRKYVRRNRPVRPKVVEAEPAEEGLDDLDLDLLGENRDEERSDAESAADGSDPPDRDMTEEEINNDA